MFVIAPSLSLHPLCHCTLFVIADLIRNPEFGWHWIPDQVRDDKLPARDDKLPARDDKLPVRDEKVPVRDDNWWLAITNPSLHHFLHQHGVRHRSNRDAI